MKRGAKTYLAKTIGKSPQAISNYLSGLRRPNWKTAKELSALTNIEIVLWMEGKSVDIRRAFDNWSETLKDLPPWTSRKTQKSEAATIAPQN
jgi:transcriptional regulator with XRE-family HTH domain